MAIDLCKTAGTSGECVFTPVCLAHQYKELWQPAIAELNLPMLACLPGLVVTPRFKDQFLFEVATLRSWAATSDDERTRRMLASLDEVRSIVAATDLSRDSISFG